VLLVELREDQHAGLRTPPAKLERRPQPVVGALRRHPHVDHRDVGPVGKRLAQEVVRVPGLGGDLESGLAEEPRDALAQEHVVLSDDHAPRTIRHHREH
jgi:hypothetical protein